MKNQHIKATLKFAFSLVVLATAYRAGVTSGALRLARLSAELDVGGRDLAIKRQSAESKQLSRSLARRSLEIALLQARQAQLEARQWQVDAGKVQLQREAPRSEDLPPDRMRALRERLHEDARQHERRLRLRAEQRGRSQRGSGT